ncbi:hypothetical protein HF289_01675 [Acidithiobacillus ferrooxidans]|uniref:hypothetical protein n=1 Tax=Acidithiobacillus ferrooxidans TaxID=920 RepID=UPI001C06CCB0|nr:hypothetical protein [Acidithiobacillus ferrooxidans]MBU2855627.1 hypothetical protein [Acidithiobacillus ferrooxidans]MBU2861739.1 hypothetical protein [Acidithiobacillus ferrooxidans]
MELNAMQKLIAQLYAKGAFYPGRFQVDTDEPREAMFLCLLQQAESCMHLNDLKKRIWQISEELLNLVELLDQAGQPMEGGMRCEPVGA